MRKIFLLIITLFIGISCWGQWEEDCKFYIGTWQYKTDNEVFTMKTKFYLSDYSDNYKIKMLLASCRYEKDGKVLFDNLNDLDRITEKSALVKIIFPAELPVGKPPVEAALTFVDKMLKKRSGCMSYVKIYSISPDKISWHLEEEEMWIGTEDMIPPPDGFTVPVDMILTKIE